MKNVWKLIKAERSTLEELKLRTSGSNVLLGSVSLLCCSIYSAKGVVSSFYEGRCDITNTVSLAYLLVTSLSMFRPRTLELASLITKLMVPSVLLLSNESSPLLCLISFFLGIWFFITTKRRAISIFYVLLQFIIISASLERSIASKFSSLTQQEAQALFELLTTNFVRLMMLTFGFLVCQKFIDSQIEKELLIHCKELQVTCENFEKKEKQLEQSIKEKETFLLKFSHEFKNALNGLLGSVQIVSESEIEPRLRKVLQSANVCGSVLKTLVQNLLDSGKFEQEKLEVARANTNMGDFISNFWQVSAELIKNKKLRGFVKLSKDVPSNLMIDQQKLLQVLLNLTSNSLKFTEEGHIYFLVDWTPIQDENRPSAGSLNSTGETEEYDDQQGPIKMPQSKNNAKFLSDKSITLDFEKKSLHPKEKLLNDSKFSQRGVLKISVVDSGFGMNEEDKAKLFKKFSQVSENVSDRNQGTGLGLWITDELVKLMGGEIKVITKKGKGTIFEVVIEAETPNASKLSPGITLNRISLAKRSTDFCASNQKFSVSSPQSPKDKVLIADDDSFNLTILQNHLSKLGRDVIIAKDGQELIEKFESNSENIAAVITDNHMPRKKGSEASRHIKKYISDHQLTNIPIFLLSGDENAIPLHQLREYGISEVISKPIDFGCIEKLIMGLKS